MLSRSITLPTAERRLRREKIVRHIDLGVGWVDRVKQRCYSHVIDKPELLAGRHGLVGGCKGSIHVQLPPTNIYTDVLELVPRQLE